MEELQVQSLDEELRSHMLCSVSKKKKKRIFWSMFNQHKDVSSH